MSLLQFLFGSVTAPRQAVEKQDCVGVDLGISRLATCSDDKIYTELGYKK